jgi:pimeloyl-ACP methyl ester carboxylesterase
MVRPMTPDTPAEVTHLTVDLPPSDGVPGGPAIYADVGQGPTLVLVHGYPGRPADFRWMVPVLPGLRVVSLAMPGLDHTPLDTCPSPTLAGRAAFVGAFLDALDLRGTVAAHSMSAGVLMHAAGRWPDRIERIGLLSPIGLRPHVGVRRSFPKVSWALATTPGLRWISEPLMSWAFPAMGFPKSLTMSAMKHSVHCAASLDFASQRAAAAAVTQPTLVAWASDDHLVEDAIPRELAAELPDGPRVNWDTGGHGSIKTRAVELGEALVAFAGG